MAVLHPHDLNHFGAENSPSPMAGKLVMAPIIDDLTTQYGQSGR
jgi:hypothetical protein